MNDDGKPLKIEPLDATLEIVTFKSTPLTEADGPTIRSCWECNSAHEHLKGCVWLVCFVCGATYKLGVKQ